MNGTGYFATTRTATYGFLAAVPLFVAYEVLIVLVNTGTPAPVRVGADVWIKQLIGLLGATGMFALGIVVLAAGLFVVLRDRKNRPPLRPRWFGWMIAESTVYAVVTALIVSQLVTSLFYGMAGPDGMGLPTMLALSLGAGLYEELVFRVFLVGGLFWALGKVGMKSVPAYVAAAVVGALVFSAVHYIGTFGDPFELPSFTFRFLFGLALNGLYLARGFGVAAWTHAIYDVLVVSGILG